MSYDPSMIGEGMLASQPDSPALWRARSNMAKARMDLVIQEVSEAVQRRVEARIVAARKRAKELRHIAEDSGGVMDIDVERVADGPGFFALCDALRGLSAAAAQFEPVFATFLGEHGDLLEQEAQEMIRKFLRWIRTQDERVASLCTPRAKEYAAGLKESVAEHAELINEISAQRALSWPGE